MRHRAAALLSGVLAMATATLALPVPAQAAVDGFDVTITELPERFRAGASARTVTVVASAEPGRRCQRVRWSMLLEADGVRLDQVRVDRVEQDGSFPLRVRADGNTARLTDVRLDPGTLCPGRTVTARYRIAFDEDADEGRVRFRAQAFDAGARLLEQASSTSRVVNDDASPSPSPSETEKAVEEDEEEEPAGEGGAAVPPGDDLNASRAATESGVRSLLGPGLVIGAVLVFLGVGLLLRIRMRNRVERRPPMPTSFYPTR